MEIINVLKISTLSHFMSDDELALLVDSYEMISYSSGSVIFSEGDISEKMFILVSGMVEITQHMGVGERELKILNIGECFGEMGLITGETRSASALAKTDVQTLALSHEKFNNLLDNHPKFSKSFLKLLVERIKHSEQTSNNYILDAYHTVLLSLSNLAEARDNETGSHLFRVREYCKKLAQELSIQGYFQDTITPLFIENIYIVSPIHDIGKVAIADNILLKPGKLDEDEFSIMKKHAKYGGDILNKLMEEIDFPTFKMAYNVANHHHERFDGSGYPDGLKGNDIPLEARIMTVSDVFDALLTKRVYKPAFDQETVKKIVQEENGRLFDPIIAGILLDQFDEFIAIYEKYAD
ncbi:MAG: cyclic nucleotide-binding domain-containing protein [Gammaproteobacteria bacterium]|nr:cyclic nucleotide-binding domain-containing protein [Gammaproteobacteria bacterium]